MNQSSLEVKIRKYEPEDKNAILKICADTGFWGKPIDPIFNERELFADMIVGPYLKYEPEHTFVAEHDGNVVGYLLGTTNPNFMLRSAPYLLKSVAKMLFKYATGGLTQRAKKQVNWIFTKAIKEAPKTPKNAAHLHINLAEGYRNIEIGKRMLAEYENMLKEAGINHYYGEVFSSDTRREPALYKRLGFEVFDRKETTHYKPEIEEPVFLMCVHKRI